MSTPTREQVQRAEEYVKAFCSLTDNTVGEVSTRFHAAVLLNDLTTLRARLAEAEAENGALHGKIGLLANAETGISDNAPTSDCIESLICKVRGLETELEKAERERDEAQKLAAKYFRELTTISADARGYNAAINLAERDQLRADLQAAREDTARLDWLESHRNAGIGATATKRIAGLSRTLEDFRDYEWKGDTVRAAIDAARAGGAGK